MLSQWQRWEVLDRSTSPGPFTGVHRGVLSTASRLASGLWPCSRSSRLIQAQIYGTKTFLGLNPCRV